MIWQQWMQSLAGKRSGGGEQGHAHSPTLPTGHVLPTVPLSLPMPPLLSSGALLCSSKCGDVLPRGHVATSGDSLGCHRGMHWVETTDAAKVPTGHRTAWRGKVRPAGVQAARRGRGLCHYSLGQSHFNLLPDLLPFLVSPPGEDVPVLQLLLAGPVPQLHRQELLLASPRQRP